VIQLCPVLVSCVLRASTSFPFLSVSMYGYCFSHLSREKRRNPHFAPQSCPLCHNKLFRNARSIDVSTEQTTWRLGMNATMELKEGVNHTMDRSKAKRSGVRQGSTETVSLLLTFDEIAALVRLSSYYGRTLGFVRRVIQLVSPGETRAKARFVQEESYWLRRFAEANRDRMATRDDTESPVDFTPRSLVAFYGRTLGTLNLPRSRRRMSAGQIEQREALAEKLRSALVMLYAADRQLVEEELQTRRLRELRWIEDVLSGPATPGEA
jgi:hypothetical protein